LGVDEKARKLNLHIDEYIVDSGVSGAKEPNKRKLGPLLEKLQPGDTLLASELSRLGRSLFMVMDILKHCMDNNVKVLTVKDNYELGDNIQSKVLAFAFGLAAEIERDLIRQRTKEALARRKANGIILGRPVGSKSSHVKLDDKRPQLEEYLKKGMSYSAIGRLLDCNRMTVAKYVIDAGLMEMCNQARHSFNLSQHPVCVSPLAGKENEILAFLKTGMRAKEIARSMKVAECTMQDFIGRNPALQKVYKEVQDKIRIERNGGMKINVPHRFGRK
jgi:DNA invertase Pin-like site-specific DNA recombinase